MEALQELGIQLILAIQVLDANPGYRHGNIHILRQDRILYALYHLLVLDCGCQPGVSGIHGALIH